MKRLLRVIAPHFVAGAVWEKRDGTWQCIEAAPIIGWMVGQSPEYVAAYLRRKVYTWQWMPEHDRS